MQFVAKLSSFDNILAPQEHIWRYLTLAAIPEKLDFAVKGRQNNNFADLLISINRKPGKLWRHTTHYTARAKSKQ